MTLLTEDDARKKWCPNARVVTYDKYANEFAAGVTVGMTAANKTSDGIIRSGASCIASDCMAWRWVLEPVIPPDFDKTTATAVPAKKERGYCGAFGKPE